MFALLLKAHWGKLLAGILLSMWIGFTVLLYNSNQDLHEQIGEASAAVKVCIVDRVNMDKALIILKEQIVQIQAENIKYKADIAIAEANIVQLEIDLAIALAGIDTEVIGESCEASMQWLREKAVQ